MGKNLPSIKPSGIQKKQNSEPTESASSLGHHKKVESRGAGCEAVEGVLTQAIQSPEVSRERGHMGGNRRGAWLLDPGCLCPQRLRSLVGRNRTTPEKKSLAVKEKAKDNLHCHPAVKPSRGWPGPHSPPAPRLVCQVCQEERQLPCEGARRRHPEAAEGFSSHLLLQREEGRY